MALIGFLEVRQNRNLVIMIVSLIVAISMFSWYGITDKITSLQQERAEESKLNQILAAADDPKNVTVIVVPADQINKTPFN